MQFLGTSDPAFNLKFPAFYSFTGLAKHYEDFGGSFAKQLIPH
jgi:hypothetical protein